MALPAVLILTGVVLAWFLWMAKNAPSLEEHGD